MFAFSGLRLDNMKMVKLKKKRAWYFSWVGSLLFHAVLLIVIAFGVFEAKDYFMPSQAGRGASNVSSDRDGAKGKASSESKDTQEPQGTTGDVKKYLNQGVKWAEEMSAPTRMRELKKRIPKLNKVATKSVEKISTLAENFGGVDRSRAYVPKADVPGRFDPKTATIYNVTRETHNDKTVYLYTLVDNKGRSADVRVSESQMSNNDLRAYRAFEFAKANPKFRRVLDAALRIGQTKVDKKRASQASTSAE